MNFTPPPPPNRTNGYTKITYNNANYITRNDNGKEVNDNTDIFYYDGANYIRLGPKNTIMQKAKADKMIFNGEIHDIRNYANDLYIQSGGYRKYKRCRRSKSNRIKKRKTKKQYK